MADNEDHSWTRPINQLTINVIYLQTTSLLGTLKRGTCGEKRTLDHLFLQALQTCYHKKFVAWNTCCR